MLPNFLRQNNLLLASVLDPLLFLAYVNDIWRNIESSKRLFAVDCIICRRILNNKHTEKLQIDLNRLGEWAFENKMINNPTKSKVICHTKT
jgi:hypothetical protein